MDLLADVPDVVARAAGHATEVGVLRGEVNRLGNQVEQLAQVLAAGLPGPPAPLTPPPKFRARAPAEVVLLGLMGMLAVLLVGLVAWQAHEREMLDQLVEQISR